MDATALARALPEPVPANRTAGIEVVRAEDGAAEGALETPDALRNATGSLHASGLVALIDAAGSAALVAACEEPAQFGGVVPLGAAATMEFLAPARGRLVASCVLGAAERAVLRPLLAGESDRVRIATVAEVRDAAGEVVCRGGFDWSVRRLPGRRQGRLPSPPETRDEHLTAGQVKRHRRPFALVR